MNTTEANGILEAIIQEYADKIAKAQSEISSTQSSYFTTEGEIAKMKNSVNTNLLILDEILDGSLDANGTDELMKILHMLEGVNLFVISHKGDILQDKFANVIRFVKEKNFSRIMK